MARRDDKKSFKPCKDLFQLLLNFDNQGQVYKHDKAKICHRLRNSVNSVQPQKKNKQTMAPATKQWNFSDIDKDVPRSLDFNGLKIYQSNFSRIKKEKQL